MIATLIRGGHVVDPANGTDAEADVLIAGGKIARVGKISLEDAKAFRLDTAGNISPTHCRRCSWHVAHSAT